MRGCKGFRTNVTTKELLCWSIHYCSLEYIIIFEKTRYRDILIYYHARLSTVDKIRSHSNLVPTDRYIYI